MTDHSETAIDHLAKVEKAVKNLKDSQFPANVIASLNANWARDIAIAQVHATLALVEQQRVENILTVSQMVAERGPEITGFQLDELRVGVAGEVWEALGLS